ncbi:MAG TPA: MraY family glycosyltransferase [Gaiellaceae bacterium]|jgi:UDP-GlcNAc:undecaprenyl-phosphate GlcNAc-1-phosphate transferase
MLQTFENHLDVLWGFLVALGVVLVLTPAVGRVARVLGVVDEPLDRRRVHLAAVPRLGGLALFLGLFIPALAFLELDGAYRGILLGAAFATAVGMVDDFRGLPWWGKLGGQIASAAIAIHFGVDIDRFTFPVLGVHDLPGWLAATLAFIWIVAIMNMVNFLDGLDGLAAGVCGISGVTFAIISLSLGKPDAAVLSAIVAGICFGFLRHNFYPARIFMGDSGALLLGFVLATVSIQGLLKTAATVSLFFPLFALAVPILDTSFVVARRLKHGEKLYEPDQAHLHHRFLRRGFSQRRAVLYLYGWCVILGGAALATRFVPFRERGEWHLWPTVVVAFIGFVAVAASLYIVYVLEILKLRRVRAWADRRREAKAEQSRALSA